MSQIPTLHHALRTTGILLLSFLLAAGCRNEEAADPGTFLIANVRIVDGAGTPAVAGAVRVKGDRIAEVGRLRPAPGEPVIDGAGRILAPGFIDTHSHHDRDMFGKRTMEEVVSQGVATIVAGQDGSSPFPLSDFWQKLDSLPVAVNVGMYTGHNTLRYEVLSEDYRREATPDETQRMGMLLARELDAGAIGLSTGLEYDPGIYSSRQEILALTGIVAEKQKRYISHLRSEDRALWSAVDELIDIGRQYRIPVQISHLKIAMVSQWEKADSLVALFDRARAEGIELSADLYPYEYWQSTMEVLLPERDFHDLEAARFALTELTRPEWVIFSAYDPNPSLIGRTLAEVAEERGESPEAVYLDLLRTARGQKARESIICKSMSKENITRFLQWPHTNICSDGGLNGRHPRGAGSFTRVLREYVREDQALTLETAIYKMTGLAADHLGLTDRGQIAPGLFADLVLFDPDRVSDRATMERPHLLSEGIDRLWVNGVTVWENQAATGHYPGKAIIPSGKPE